MPPTPTHPQSEMDSPHAQRSEFRKSGRNRKLALIAAVVAVLLVVLLFTPNSPAGRLLHQDTTWRSMQQRKVWRVGMDPSFPPFEMLGDDGVATGYDVDLARQIAASWGMDVEIVAIGYDSLLDALLTDQVDSIVSAYPYDPRLTKDIAYSEPYFEAGLRLAAPLGSSIVSTDDLAGRTVAVEWGSTGDMIGRQLQRDGVALELLSFATPQEAIDSLLDGSADALLVDNVTLRQAQGNGAQLSAVGAVLDGTPYVIAMPVEAYDLHHSVAAAMSKLHTDGMMSALENVWFGPASNAQPADDSAQDAASQLQTTSP